MQKHSLTERDSPGCHSDVVFPGAVKTELLENISVMKILNIFRVKVTWGDRKSKSPNGAWPGKVGCLQSLL